MSAMRGLIILLVPIFITKKVCPRRRSARTNKNRLRFVSWFSQVTDNVAGVAGGEHVRRDIFSYNTSSTDDGSVANSNPRANHSTSANPDIAADINWFCVLQA